MREMRLVISLALSLAVIWGLVFLSDTGHLVEMDTWARAGLMASLTAIHNCLVWGRS